MEESGGCGEAFIVIYAVRQAQPTKIKSGTWFRTGLSQTGAKPRFLICPLGLPLGSLPPPHLRQQGALWAPPGISTATIRLTYDFKRLGMRADGPRHDITGHTCRLKAHPTGVDCPTCRPSWRAF